MLHYLSVIGKGDIETI